MERLIYNIYIYIYIYIPREIERETEIQQKKETGEIANVFATIFYRKQIFTSSPY